MEYRKSFDIRDLHQGPRFCVHVVQGAGEKNPGKLKTLRFDDNLEPSDWIKIHWIERQERRVGIEGITLAPTRAKRGSFFMLDAYDEDPDERKRTEGKALFQKWAALLEARQNPGPFPEEWLPQKVLDLAKHKPEPVFQAPKFNAPKLDAKKDDSGKK
jgi:hypothetical protein